MRAATECSNDHDVDPVAAGQPIQPPLLFEVEYGAQCDVDLHELVRVEAACEMDPKDLVVVGARSHVERWS